MNSKTMYVPFLQHTKLESSVQTQYFIAVLKYLIFIRSSPSITATFSLWEL
jgi:hypothetical protein